jgi:hypothetical protein
MSLLESGGYTTLLSLTATPVLVIITIRNSRLRSCELVMSWPVHLFWQLLQLTHKSCHFYGVLSMVLVSGLCLLDHYRKYSVYSGKWLCVAYALSIRCCTAQNCEHCALWLGNLVNIVYVEIRSVVRHKRWVSELAYFLSAWHNGHVHRTEENIIPKRVLYMNLVTRLRGRLRNT